MSAKAAAGCRCRSRVLRRLLPPMPLTDPAKTAGRMPSRRHHRRSSRFRTCDQATPLRPATPAAMTSAGRCRPTGRDVVNRAGESGIARYAAVCARQPAAPPRPHRSVLRRRADVPPAVGLRFEDYRAGTRSWPVRVRACSATSSGPARRTPPRRRAKVAARPVASISQRAQTSRSPVWWATQRRPSRRTPRTRSVTSVTLSARHRARSTGSNRARSTHHPAPSGEPKVSDATKCSLPHADSDPPQHPSVSPSTGPRPAAAKTRAPAPGSVSLGRRFVEG